MYVTLPGLIGQQIAVALERLPARLLAISLSLVNLPYDRTRAPATLPGVTFSGQGYLDLTSTKIRGLVKLIRTHKYGFTPFSVISPIKY